MMMRQLVLLGLLIYGLLLLSLATLNGALLALALPFVVYLGAGLLYQPRELQLKATRSLSSGRVAHGAPAIVKLSITNEGSWLEEVYLEDLLPRALKLIDGQSRVLTSLKPGGTIELEYTVCGKRGSYHFPGIQVTVSDRLGLFRKRAMLPVPGQLFVLPELFRLRRVDIRPRRTRIYSGFIPARQGGPGVEFFGVREYQPGDSMRWINGRASARHLHALFVNEFEQERIADVGLILDARQRSDARTPDGSLFEYGIQAVATLADAFLTEGNRVGLLMYGNGIQWTFPGYGKVQRERILSALARASQGEGVAFEDLDLMPARLFPARSQLVLISPLLSKDLDVLIKLRARGYQLLVISPDPIHFEQQRLGSGRAVELASRIARLERELLLRKLRQARIHVIDWQVDRPFHQVAHTALSRLPLWLRGREDGP